MRTTRPQRRWASPVQTVMLSAALLLVGCSEPSSEELLASARKHLAAHEPEAARLELKTLLQSAPESGEARLMLGKLMRDVGEWASAEAELRRALEARQPEATVLPLLAETMLAQGKSSQLLQQFGKTDLADAAADAELKTQLAAATAADGDNAGAGALLDSALRRQPDLVPALLLRAKLSAQSGDVALALKQVDALLQRNPDAALAWSLKGDLLAHAGAQTDMTAAAAAWRKSLERMPDAVGVHGALITSLLAKPDVAAAEAQFAQMKKAAPRHPQTLYFEALLAGQRGDAKLAREILQQLLRGAPDNLRVLLLAGHTELKLGAVAQAESHFAHAVQVAPKAPGVRRVLAEVQLRGGQSDKALTTLRPLLDAQPPDGDALALAAQAQLMKSDGKAADALFERAAKAKPADTRIRTALAVAQLSKGNDSAGFSELQAIAGADRSTVADLALVSARLRRNDLAGALKAIDALAAKTPTAPLPDQLRGRIALQRKDLATARRHFEQALAKDPDYLPALAALAALDVAAQQPAAATARLEAVVARNPRHIGAMLTLAELASRDGDAARASQWLQQAIKAEPGQAAPRMALVDLQLASRQPKLALATAQAGVAAVPDSAELVDRLGRAQLLDGDHRGAIASFTKLAGLLPKSALPQLRLADAYLAASDQEAVASSVRRAQSIAPDDPTVQQAAVNLAVLQDKLPQALAIAREMQQRHADDAAGYLIEGELATRQKQWDAAAAAYRKALTRSRPGEGAQRLHSSLSRGGRPAEADRFAAEWRQSHPTDQAFLLYLGDAATAAKQPALAEQHYRAVLALAPDSVPALNNLAFTLATQNKPGAVALAEQALKLAPDSAAVMDTLALGLAAQQQLPQAIAMQARAVSQEPDIPVFRLQLAKLQLRGGDAASARNELQALAKLGDKFDRQAEVQALLKANGG